MDRIIVMWAFLGTIYLFILTWQENRNKLKIDARKNYFMMGLSLSLIAYLPRSIWYILGVLAMSFTYNYVCNRYRLLKPDDVSTSVWILYGFAYINIVALGLFVLVLGVLGLIYRYIKRNVYSLNRKAPYYSVIAASFVLTCAFFAFYLH